MFQATNCFITFHKQSADTHLHSWYCLNWNYLDQRFICSNALVKSYSTNLDTVSCRTSACIHSYKSTDSFPLHLCKHDDSQRACPFLYYQLCCSEHTHQYLEEVVCHVNIWNLIFLGGSSPHFCSVFIFHFSVVTATLFWSQTWPQLLT